MFPNYQKAIAPVCFALTLCILIACANNASTTPVTATPFPLVGPPTYTPIRNASVLAASATTPSPATEGAYVNAFGVNLPPDAAPPAQQYLRFIVKEGSNIDFPVSVYQRSDPPAPDILATPLVRMDKNFEIVPAGAERWEVSADGLTWTFHLDPNLKWSDGNPVTAGDYVFTFQYQADPKHAWDFAWYWTDIKNWDKALKGEVPLSDIGVKQVDDYTLQFITESPAPYLPAQVIYARPLSKQAFAKYGEYYNNKPETSVSSSPWRLTEWTKGKQMVFGPNKNYTGKIKPYLERLIFTFGDPTTVFNAYEANEVDVGGPSSAGDLEFIMHDAVLNQEYHPGYGDFRTDYLVPDTTKPPFDKLEVRQAFAQAIDRDALVEKIVKTSGIRAYSYLMPGFPDSSYQELKSATVNQYDPAAARKLLAEGGYPDGKGFPPIELWLREGSDQKTAVANAIAGMLSQNLHVQIQVSVKERKVFNDAVGAHRLPLFMSSYGFDYLDASNMLSVWRGSDPAPWQANQFVQLVDQAASTTNDPAKRTLLFHQAEKILVENVGGIFLYHETPGSLYKPYVKGSELEPDNTGVATMHWPGIEDIGMLGLTVYISRDVANYRK